MLGLAMGCVLVILGIHENSFMQKRSLANCRFHEVFLKYAHPQYLTHLWLCHYVPLAFARNGDFRTRAPSLGDTIDMRPGEKIIHVHRLSFSSSQNLAWLHDICSPPCSRSAAWHLTSQ